MTRNMPIFKLILDWEPLKQRSCCWAAATTQLLFTPVGWVDATHVYMNALRIEDDTKDTITFNTRTIETDLKSTLER